MIEELEKLERLDLQCNDGNQQRRQTRRRWWRQRVCLAKVSRQWMWNVVLTSSSKIVQINYLLDTLHVKKSRRRPLDRSETTGEWSKLSTKRDREQKAPIDSWCSWSGRAERSYDDHKYNLPANWRSYLNMCKCIPANERLPEYAPRSINVRWSYIILIGVDPRLANIDNLPKIDYFQKEVK